MKQKNKKTEDPVETKIWDVDRGHGLRSASFFVVLTRIVEMSARDS